MKSARVLPLAATGLVLMSVVACTSTVQGSGSPVSEVAATTSSAPSNSGSPSPNTTDSPAAATRTTAESGGSQPPAQHTTTSPSHTPAQHTTTSPSHTPAQHATATATATTSPTQLPTPPGLPTLGAALDYNPACPLDAASQQNASAEVTLHWTVTNATGIKVGIDDANIADGTPFSGTSGQQDLTLLHCYQPYTFDVWTTGGASGQTAHDRFVYNPSS